MSNCLTHSVYYAASHCCTVNVSCTYIIFLLQCVFCLHWSITLPPNPSSLSHPALPHILTQLSQPTLPHFLTQPSLTLSPNPSHSLTQPSLTLSRPTLPPPFSIHTAPLAPRNLALEVTSSQSIRVSWTKPLFFRGQLLRYEVCVCLGM